MDDVTIDVEQYGDDDGIKLSDNPTFAMTADHPDPVDEGEEDYQLTSADAPEFVTKFEVPETELEPLKKLNPTIKILIQPTSTDSERRDTYREEARQRRSSEMVRNSIQTSKKMKSLLKRKR